ncbi:unnamed protein product [Moneuplotes crassus]|uniref:Uncharacterized protein n=1 Tax=Euplotes crassus TaxID=5936 RepID=A0AAD2D7J2_EUPCR|nr:unnamed protein product [Moneuplotes crassus]
MEYIVDDPSLNPSSSVEGSESGAGIVSFVILAFLALLVITLFTPLNRRTKEVNDAPANKWDDSDRDTDPDTDSVN